MKPLLVYHGDCPDGFGAAYSFWKKYGDGIEYYAALHGGSLPEKNLILNREIYIADFCFKKESMPYILEHAKSVVVLDHHVTAMNQMEDYGHPKLSCTFDMSKSGAVMAWEHCFPGVELPELIKYVQDRDLNTWKVEHSKEVLSSLDSIERSFKSWDLFAKKIETEEGLSLVKANGRSIIAYIDKLSEHISKNIFTLNICGIDVPTINTSVFFRSDILNKMAESSESGIAAGFNYDGSKFIFSLRSSGDVDVAKIAESFPGGGGHKAASGFTVESLDELNISGGEKV